MKHWNEVKMEMKIKNWNEKNFNKNAKLKWTHEMKYINKIQLILRTPNKNK